MHLKFQQKLMAIFGNNNQSYMPKPIVTVPGTFGGLQSITMGPSSGYLSLSMWVLLPHVLARDELGLQHALPLHQVLQVQGPACPSTLIIDISDFLPKHASWGDFWKCPWCLGPPALPTSSHFYKSSHI
jgi:hypothetical protein